MPPANPQPLDLKGLTGALQQRGQQSQQNLQAVLDQLAKATASERLTQQQGVAQQRVANLQGIVSQLNQMRQLEVAQSEGRKQRALEGKVAGEQADVQREGIAAERERTTVQAEQDEFDRVAQNQRTALEITQRMEALFSQQTENQADRLSRESIAEESSLAQDARGEAANASRERTAILGNLQRPTSPRELEIQEQKAAISLKSSEASIKASEAREKVAEAQMAKIQKTGILGDTDISDLVKRERDRVSTLRNDLLKIMGEVVEGGTGFGMGILEDGRLDVDAALQQIKNIKDKPLKANLLRMVDDIARTQHNLDQLEGVEAAILNATMGLRLKSKGQPIPTEGGKGEAGAQSPAQPGSDVLPSDFQDLVDKMNKLGFGSDPNNP